MYIHFTSQTAPISLYRQEYLVTVILVVLTCVDPELLKEEEEERENKDGERHLTTDWVMRDQCLGK